MSYSKFSILLLALKLILAKPGKETFDNTRQYADDRFLSGIQILYPGDEHLCGGVLITNQHVLTSAYCVEAFEEGWDLTRLVLSSGDGSQIRHATTFSIHGGYNRETQENDLAVIQVSPHFSSDNSVNPIGIITKNTTENCFVITWSLKEKFITLASSQKAKQVFKRPMDACSINVTHTLCMGSDKNVTVCEEDYGCPLVCNGLLTGIFIGPGHACDGYPGVYVDLRPYRSWLKKAALNYIRSSRFSVARSIKRSGGTKVVRTSWMTIISLDCLYTINELLMWFFKHLVS